MRRMAEASMTSPRGIKETESQVLALPDSGPGIKDDIPEVLASQSARLSQPKSDQEPASHSASRDGDHDHESKSGSTSQSGDQESISQSDQSIENPTATQVGEKLSKRQLRKLKKREIWENVRRERRKEERHRRQERKQEAAAKGEAGPTRKRVKVDPNKESKCKITVAIDMSFDDLMSEKDTKRALTQIQYCYSTNRRAENPMQLYVTSFNGKSRQMFDRTRGCVNWDEKCVRLRRENYSDVFPEKTSLVYLTSESPNVLDRLDDGKVYIIGGLVDHNSHKGLCHGLAEEKGLNHARLPIDEYVVMKTRRVLTINHVFEVMLRYTEMGDWEKAFFDVLPKRKEVSKKL